ncbi:hypothetical protein [Nostoc sp.]
MNPSSPHQQQFVALVATILFNTVPSALVAALLLLVLTATNRQLAVLS